MHVTRDAVMVYEYTWSGSCSRFELLAKIFSPALSLLCLQEASVTEQSTNMAETIMRGKIAADDVDLSHIARLDVPGLGLWIATA